MQLVLLGIGVGGPVAHAAQVTVGTSPADYPTLQLALAAGETEILLLTGTHAGGARVLAEGTLIDGEPGASIVGGPGVQLEILANLVTVSNVEFQPSASTIDQRFAVLVEGATTVVLSDVTISDGWTLDPQLSGGLVIEGSTVTVERSTFTNNHGSTGGAIQVRGGSVVSVLDSTFTGNRAEASGGAIYSIGSSLTVSGSTFTDNQALVDWGGGIYAFQQPVLTVTDTTFHNESAPLGGAAIEADGVTTVDLVGITVEACTGSSPVDLYQAEAASVTGSTFDANEVGAIWGYETTAVSIDDTWFCGAANNADSQLYLQYGCTDCTVRNSVFVGSTSAGPGGAMRVRVADGPMVIEDTMMISNEAATGAALSLEALSSTFTLQRLLVGDNQGSEALHADAATGLTVEDVGTFGNTVGDGSGMLAGPLYSAVTPVLTATGNRCGTVPATLACDPDNDPIWRRQLGPAFDDDDADGVPTACDCDDSEPGVGWAPCPNGFAEGDPADRLPGGAPSSTPTDEVTGTPQGEPPTGALDATTWLSGGGGCACVSAPGGAAPGVAWVALLGWLVRRRARP